MLQHEHCDPHEYDREMQTTNKGRLISLEQQRDDLRQRVSVLERKETRLSASIDILRAEIVSCKKMETDYTLQITALVATLEQGDVARALLQNQDNAQASLPVESDAIFTHSGSGDLGRQRGNCKILVDMVSDLLKKDPLSIMPGISNAVLKNSTAWTAEEGVLGNIGAISVIDEDTAQTLRHVLFSEEFQNRDLQARRDIARAKGINSGTAVSESKRIMDYVSKMITSIEMFSSRLVAIELPTGSSGLLCVVVKEFYDADDFCGDPVVPTITQGDSSATPLVSVRMEDYFQICGLSLYNLGDQDLLFSGSEFRRSAELHNGDFLMRGRAKEVPEHDSGIVPANGFAFLYRIQTDWEEDPIVYHLVDAKDKIIVTFNLHFKKA